MIGQQLRESTFFLTFKLIILEFFFGIIFLFFTGILDFFELGSQETIKSIISTEGGLMSVIVIIQIILTVFVVLRWVYNYYEWSDEQVIHHTGILILHEKSMYFKEAKEIILRQGIFGRLLRYGNIDLLSSNAETLISLSRISKPQRYINVLRKQLTEVKREN